MLNLLWVPIVSAILWRLRGGAIDTLLNLRLGTQVARTIIASFYGLILFSITGSLLSFLIIPALFLGLVISGWGPYMGMGYHWKKPNVSWIDMFPRALKLKPESLAWDSVGMIVCGFLLSVPLVVFLFPLLAFNSLWFLVVTILFPLAYFLVSRLPEEKLPGIKRFVDSGEHEPYGELLFGLFFGILLVLIF